MEIGPKKAIDIASKIEARQKRSIYGFFAKSAI